MREVFGGVDERGGGEEMSTIKRFCGRLNENPLPVEISSDQSAAIAVKILGEIEASAAVKTLRGQFVRLRRDQPQTWTRFAEYFAAMFEAAAYSYLRKGERTGPE